MFYDYSQIFLLGNHRFYLHRPTFMFIFASATTKVSATLTKVSVQRYKISV